MASPAASPKSSGQTSSTESWVRSQLFPGEILCWIGQEPLLRYSLRKLVRLLFTSVITALGVGILAFTLALNPYIFRNPWPDLLPILLLMGGVLFGMGHIFRGILAFRRGGPDVYVITNQRAMIIGVGEGSISLFGGSKAIPPGRLGSPAPPFSGQELFARSFGPEALRNLEIRRKQDGTGDILFEHNIEWSSDLQGRPTRSENHIGFFGLPNIDEVARQLKQVRPL